MSNEMIKASSNLEMFSSVRTSSREDQIAVFNMINNSSGLNDMEGKTISLKDIVIQPYTDVNEATGEVKDSKRFILIDSNGKSYATTSVGVETSIKNMFGIFGAPTWDDPIDVKIVKKQSNKNKNYKFTTLELVK